MFLQANSFGIIFKFTLMVCGHVKDPLAILDSSTLQEVIRKAFTAFHCQLYQVKTRGIMLVSCNQCQLSFRWGL